MFQTPSTILPKTRDQLLTIPYSGTNFSFCLCYFSVSVIKHWPKTMWGQSVYYSLQFMGHLEGKSGHQPKAGTWGFVDCFLACSPWVAQFAFFISHSITSIEIKNMLDGLVYRQSDRGIFFSWSSLFSDGSSMCQVDKKTNTADRDSVTHLAIITNV